MVGDDGIFCWRTQETHMRPGARRKEKAPGERFLTNGEGLSMSKQAVAP